MIELFGFKFERIKNTTSQEKFTEPSSDDGSFETNWWWFLWTTSRHRW